MGSYRDSLSRLVIVLVMLSCATINLAQESTDNTQSSADPIIPGLIGPDSYPENINPLTGLTVEDPDVLTRRPIVVKVSNSPALVRPQAGLGQADLVFEHYTEVGITRFSAIFYGETPNRVGSIRSARLIDYELVPMYEAILAFSGASIGVDKRIYGSEAVRTQLCQNREDYEQCLLEADIIAPPNHIPPSEFADRAYKGVYYGAPYYWREEEKPIPHNMFVNPESLWELADNLDSHVRPNLQGMAFHAEPPDDAIAVATEADIRYKTTLAQWKYNPTTGLYERFTDGVQHFDENTDEPVTAANVIIVYAGHYLTDIIESQWEDTIHWSKQITVWPEGDAIVLRDGLRYDVKWVRPTRPELMTFETHTGDSFPLKPGNSWIQLVPLPSQMEPEVEWVTIR